MVFMRIYEYVYNKYFKKPDEEIRNIKLNIKQIFPCSNRVKTTKYTPYNFIFKNLYEQLCIPSNLYFVFIAVLQSTPQVSSTQGYPIVLLPLIIVLLFSALKDGYEDYQRYLSDNQLNNNIVQIVNLPYVTDQSKLLHNINTTDTNTDSNTDNNTDSNFDSNFDTPISSNFDISDPCINTCGITQSNTTGNRGTGTMDTGTMDKSTKDTGTVGTDTNGLDTKDTGGTKSSKIGSKFFKSRDKSKKSKVDEFVGTERYDFVEGALRNKVLVNKYWKDLKVGEYVFLQNKDISPADLVLLATSEENGFAYVDASSLDGETNIKKKESIYDVYNELGSDFEHVITEVQRLLGHFKCEGPNKNLISFDGHLKYLFSDKITPIPLNNEMKKLITNYKFKLNSNNNSLENVNSSVTVSGPPNSTNTTSKDTGTIVPSTVTEGKRANFTGTECTMGNMDTKGVITNKEDPLGGSGGRGPVTVMENLRSESINEFEKNINESKETQVNLNNLLLRECKLVNTQWIIGFVVYTGHDTKIYKNISKAPYKVSNLQKKMMKTTLLICIIQFILCLVATFYNLYIHTNKVYEKYSYLSLETRASGFYIFIIYYLSWMALTANFVPISAIVTLNAVKLIQGFFIQFDDSMYCHELKMNAKARNTMLNEELGQIKYLFSDKTGTPLRCLYTPIPERVLVIYTSTLTCNKMEFRKFSIMGHSYGKGYTDVIRFVYAKKGIFLESEVANPNYDKESHVNLVDDVLFKELNDPNHPRHEYLIDFFLHLAINNWAVPDSSNNRIYMCPSPDELCFVNAAAFCGFRLLQRNSNFVLISIFNQIYKIKIIAQADFDYKRKCSTTIISISHTNPLKPIGTINDPANRVTNPLNPVNGVNPLNTVNSNIKGKVVPLGAVGTEDTVGASAVTEETENNRIILYCKGGDNIMIKKLKEIKEVDVVTLRNMKKYSVGGLRTLVFAKREIELNEFNEWLKEYNRIKLTIESRDEKLAECVSKLECDLELQGVTGIEDKLQTGVSECIEQLLMAGIRIWMLTGDNLDTSINIGIATNLVNMLSDRIMLDSNTVPNDKLFLEMKKHINRIDQENNITKHRCLILDSMSIEYIFSSITGSGTTANNNTSTKGNTGTKDTGTKDNMDKDKEAPLGAGTDGTTGRGPVTVTEEIFIEILKRVHSVICCRMTPYLKGAVVTFVKNKLGGITLAVGDGANDCNMIQIAHVGIGIKGREGSQAFNASDFGIGEFRFLSPLILHHGRLCYRNLSKCISYMFYKNVILIIPLFFYAYISLFSGQKIYYSLFVAIYNVVFTSIPVGIFGIVDQDYNREFSVKYPHVYQLGQINHYFNVIKFSGWILNAIIQSAVIFFMMTVGLGDEFSIPFPYGLIADAPTLGIMLLSSVFIIVSCKLVLETWYFTKITLLSHLISIFFFIITVCSFSSSPIYSANSIGSAFVLFTSYRFWIVILGTLMLSMYRDYFYKVFKYSFCPQYYHHVQKVEYLKIEQPVTF
uniref:Phospholipid-transporting ATPase n=1 Tax=Theileria annulata TaxID=5874 RepID=A0A3B0N4Z5_THEAN